MQHPHVEMLLLVFTSESLQSLLLAFLSDDEEEGHAQCHQDHGAADGEEFLYVLALATCRFDGRNGTCAKTLLGRL